MKVLMINGSPHAGGTTFAALQEVAKSLEKAGVESETVHIGTKPMQGCIACGKCKQTKRCVFSDLANELIEKLDKADALVVGTPVYYAGANGALCALLDRMFYAGSTFFVHKPAAAVAVCRRAGDVPALDRLHKYFSICQMPVISSDYWAVGYGRNAEDFSRDGEGVHTMQVLGANMAHWLQMKAECTRQAPVHEAKVWTHFID